MGQRILYFNSRDPSYPRDERIVEHLRSIPDTAADILPMPQVRGPQFVRILLRSSRLVWHALRRGHYDVIVLAPFCLQYACLSWIASRVHGAIHVVDGFIGLYETRVEDRAELRPDSVAARVLRFLDLLAYRTADIYLIDTDVRAASILEHYRGSKPVIALPVGAPRWARNHCPEPPGRSPLRILYYGNYIPLHGVEHLVSGVARASAASALRLTLVGHGQTQLEVLRLVTALHVEGICDFLEPVAPEELLRLLATHHVVAGVFGDSEKAQGVVANKVWQGLSAGRVVITRESPALHEVAATVGSQLVVVPGGNSDAIASALASLCRSLQSGSLPMADPSIADRLEAYVNARYEALTTALASEKPQGRRSRRSQGR